MKSHSSKEVRLQLVTSRTRKTRPCKGNAPVAKQVSTARTWMDVTIRHKDSRTKDTAKEMRELSSRVQVTEFSLPQKGENSGFYATERHPSGYGWMSLEGQISPQTVRLPQNGHNHQQKCQLMGKQQLTSELANKDKQVRFYSCLLQQRRQRNKNTLKQIKARYESQIESMKTALSEQLTRQQQMEQNLDEYRSNKAYQLRRELINREGRMGLNFSRQQLSLLSGMSSIVPSSNRNSLTQRKVPPVPSSHSHSSQRDRASLNYLLNYQEPSFTAARRISFNHP